MVTIIITTATSLMMQSYCRVVTNRMRGLSFWSRSSPPYTEFSLVHPVPSSTAYSPDIIPRHILRPAYATTGQVLTELIPAQPVIWSEQQVDKVSGDTQSYRVIKILIFFHLDPEILSAC